MNSKTSSHHQRKTERAYGKSPNKKYKKSKQWFNKRNSGVYIGPNLKQKPRMDGIRDISGH